jgi:hypothetical protein
VIAALVPELAVPVVEAQVLNRDAADIRAGQAARLVVDPSTVFDATVVSISPDARFNESQTGTYRVLVRPDGNLRLGLAMEVRFLTRRESVLSLLLIRIKRAFDHAG